MFLAEGKTILLITHCKVLKTGKICIIDTETMKVIKSFEGGNQPTGLDISLDDKILCFSNFQDGNIELYNIDFESDVKK